MAPLSRAETDLLRAQILQGLSETAFACSSLTHLTSGTTNFVFRGSLVQPLSSKSESPETSTTSIIVKHATDFAAVNRDFPLDATRCVITLLFLSRQRLPLYSRPRLVTILSALEHDPNPFRALGSCSQDILYKNIN